MNPRIVTLTEKKLIGKRLKMSFANNRTFELWHSFMPRRHEILHRVSTDFLSMQVYDGFLDFNPHKEFEKWAVVEVENFETVPTDMETYILKGGLYAVFIHVGLASNYQKTFQSIFNDWLPNSDFELDDREHFELLGEKYKNNDPNSEEEVWIPIKLKA